MDSRQIAFLILAIFISMLAFGQSANESITITQINQTIPSDTKVESANNSMIAASAQSQGSNLAAVPVTTTKSSQPSESTIAIMPSTTAVPNKSVTETVDTSATTVDPLKGASTAAPATINTTLPTSSTASIKSTEAVNDHSIRDVSSDKCSTSYNAADKVNWVPEKAILAVMDGEVVVTVEQFCKQLGNVNRLDAICDSTKAKWDSDDGKVAPVVAGLTSMFSSICSDPKTALNVTVGGSTACVESVQTITKNCSTSPNARAVHIFPTEVLFDEMVKENCTVVFNTKECIIKGIEKSDKCTVAQGSAVTQAIVAVTKILPCNLPFSAETTPPATAAPTTTTPKVVPTKTPSHNSATSFQVNFFTVLPVLLLVFNFY